MGTKAYPFSYYVDHVTDEVLEDSLVNMVARDVGILEIDLQENASLTTVETDLDFPLIGAYSSIITWNASAHSGVTNLGVVTQAIGDVTANVIATITLYGESDTKTFAVTVLKL